MANRLLIRIDPPLVCQFTHPCGHTTDRAIIHTNGLQPIRWVMTPVCATCLLTAMNTPPKPTKGATTNGKATY